jgi:hypothetical protein
MSSRLLAQRFYGQYSRIALEWILLKSVDFVPSTVEGFQWPHTECACSAHLPVGRAYDVQKAVKRLLFGLGSKQYDREDCADEGSAKKTGL